MLVVLCLLGCSGSGPAQPDPPAPPAERAPAWSRPPSITQRTPVLLSTRTADGVDAVVRALARRLEARPDDLCLDGDAPLGPISWSATGVTGYLPTRPCTEADKEGAVGGGTDPGTVDPSPLGDGAEQHRQLLVCAESDDTDALECEIQVEAPDGVDPGLVYRTDRLWVYSRLCETPEDAPEVCTVTLAPLDGAILPGPDHVEGEATCEDEPELCRLPLELVTPRPPAADDEVDCHGTGAPLFDPSPEYGACADACQAAAPVEPAQETGCQGLQQLCQYRNRRCWDADGNTKCIWEEVMMECFVEIYLGCREEAHTENGGATYTACIESCKQQHDVQCAE